MDQSELYAEHLKSMHKNKSSNKYDNRNTDHKNKPYGKHKSKNLRLTEGLINRPENSDNFEDVSLPNKGRAYTVSIAVPASILEITCPLEDSRLGLVGQLARFTVMFGIDEIIVYNDHCWKTNNANQQAELIELMSTVLAYQECPQYLRKKLFPMSPFLAKAGSLNPTAAPHHLRMNQWCPYREGAVVGRWGKSKAGSKGSLVDVGLSRNISVTDTNVNEGDRVTVKLPPSARVLSSPCGELVSPQEPRQLIGLYWGYSVRVADTLAQVFSECDDPEGYDYLLGTSDRGTDVADLTAPQFKKALIVFGGVDGLETSLSRDTALTASCPEHLFDAYINVLPSQQTRTIRTEEAVPLTLMAVMPKMKAAHE